MVPKPVDPVQTPDPAAGRDGIELRIMTGGFQHLLDSTPLGDGDPLQMLTADGWVTGHYRALLHPETGQCRFDLHVRVSEQDGAVEHVGLWLPQSARLRRCG